MVDVLADGFRFANEILLEILFSTFFLGDGLVFGSDSAAESRSYDVSNSRDLHIQLSPGLSTVANSILFVSLFAIRSNVTLTIALAFVFSCLRGC